MKKCSYCGAEYPDGTIVCSVDQTPLDKNNLATNPVVATAIKCKIPIRLSIVSYCFFASGISYLGFLALSAYLGKFLLLNLIIGVLNLFVSRGLRRCSNRWRIFTLVYILLCFIGIGFKNYQKFKYPTHFPRTEHSYLISWGLSFAMFTYFYYVLIQPEIRKLFNDNRDSAA